MDGATVFSRNTMVWGKDQQEILSNASVLIAGVGGLGCFVAEMLVRNGIKKLVLVDYDTVSETDLNRQLLYTQSDIGKSKVETAADRLTAIHGLSAIIPICCDLQDSRHLDYLIKHHNILGVADCLDNYTGRCAVEKAISQNQFLVHGGVQDDFGQVTTIRKDRGCRLSDLYRNVDQALDPIPVCIQAVAAVGSIMVQEILNNLWGHPQLLSELLLVELRDYTFSRIRLY